MHLHTRYNGRESDIVVKLQTIICLFKETNFWSVDRTCNGHRIGQPIRDADGKNEQCQFQFFFHTPACW